MRHYSQDNRQSGRNPLDTRRGGRQITKYESEPIHIKLGRVSHHSAMFVFRTAAAFVAVMIVLIGVAYAVISRGPVSLPFLVKTIENSIQRQLGDVSVKIDDTVMQRAEHGLGIVFRIKGLRLVNRQGATIAQAPAAAIGISGWGLLSGQIAPSSVHFIGPELLLVETKDGGLELAFTQKSAGNAAGGSYALPDNTLNSGDGSSSLTNRIGETLAAARAQQVDLVQTLQGIIRNAREGSTATSYLSRFGVRDAVVILSSDKSQTAVNVPGIEINLEHKSNSSVIRGRAKLSEGDGPWDIQFSTELNQNSNQIRVLVEANNLTPSSFSAILPRNKALKAIQIPLNGMASLDLSQNGELLRAESDLTIGKGRVKFSDDQRRDLIIDKGNLRVKYERDKGLIEVQQSSIHWRGSHAVFSGGIKSGKDQNGLGYWQFLLQTQDAAIETREYNIPRRKIDNWSMRGYIIPSQKRVNLEQLLIQSGNSFLDLSGDIIDSPGSPEILLNGKISPMEITFFKQLWPRFVAPGARDWIGERVTKGYVTGGNVRVALPGGMLEKLSKGEADIDQNSFNFSLGLKDIETYYVRSLPPMQAKDATARFSGRGFVMEVPNAHIALPSGQQVRLQQGSFTIPDLRQDPQDGEIAFNTEGKAGELLEFLDLPSLGYLKEANFTPDMITGSMNGQVQMKLPLVRDVKFSDMKMDGKVVLREANFINVVKDMDIGNGTITFGLTHQAVNAQGRIYINGVPANISWHRIFKGAVDKQPGVRINANLNSEKLDKLGIPVGHFIKGDVPTSINIKSSDNGKQLLQLVADLNNAELVLGKLGWTKPPGKRAALELDILPQEDGRTDIRNFRILGDDIAITGELSLAKDGKLDYFSFPDFSVNIVTRLSLQGKRDPRHGWKIKVNGPTYDGRQFFKSIFSTGEVTKGQEASVDKSDVEIAVSINTVLGFSNTRMSNVRVFMQQREGRMTVFEAKGDLEEGKLLAKLKYDDKEARILRAETNNSGYAFRMIGFYPNIVGGETALQVNLDAAGGTKQSGTLWTRSFAILGDEVVQEVLSSSSSSEDVGIVGEERRRRARTRTARERIEFDQMKVIFATGKGLFELRESYIKGPAVGVFLHGDIDFEQRKINLGGTYVPVYGLNSLLAPIPLIGEKGILGVTFGVQGSLDAPQVVVNPASIVGIGILRGLFEFNSQGKQGSSENGDTFPN